MKWWYFFVLKVIMTRGRRLKKCGGDLEAQKQNVVSSKQTIGKQNVNSLQLGLGNKMLLHQN
jgi:hypothetical protein